MEKGKIKISAELDDSAYTVGTFVHQLGEVQEQKLDALFKDCKEHGWTEGLDDETLYDWLFDYVFNNGAKETFSEYLNIPNTEVE
jgi:hypothetical protein